MAFVAATRLAGANGTTAVVTIPAGTAADQLAYVGMYCEVATAITAPDGTWTQIADLAAGTPSATGRYVLFRKRLTTAETGTWTFSGFGSLWREADAVLFSGRSTSATPETVSPAEGTASTTLVIPALTANAGDDMLVVGSNATANTLWVTNPPSGTTLRAGQSGDNEAAYTQDSLSAGSTGTRTLTWNSSTGAQKGALVVIALAAPPDPGWGNYLLEDGSGALLQEDATYLLLDTNGVGTGASVTGTATVTAAGTVSAGGGSSTGASLAATDAVTTSGTVGALVGALALTAAVTTAGVIGTSTGSSVSESATVTTAGSVGRGTGASIAGTAALAAAGTAGNASGSALTSTATTTATGVVGATTGASVTGSAALTATGTKASSTGATQNATAATTGTGAVGAATGATLAATGSLSASGTIASTGTASITASSTITAAGTVAGSSVGQGANLTLAGSRTAAGTVGLSTGATASYVVATTSAGTVGRTAGATVTTTAATSASGAVGVATAGTVAATNALTTSGSVGSSQSASLNAAATLTATGTIGVAGPVVTVLNAVEHVRTVTLTEHIRKVTLAEHVRAITATEHTRTITVQGGTMILSKFGKDYYGQAITTSPAVSGTAWEASFDGGTTWVASTVWDGVPAWLVAGPSCPSPGAATVLPGDTLPQVRLIENPVVVVKTAARIYVR